MITTVLLKELQNHLLNKSIIFIWFVIIGLFILNVFAFTFQYKDESKKYEDIVIENNQTLAYDKMGSGKIRELEAILTGEPFDKINMLPDMIWLTQNLPNQSSPLMFLSGTSEGTVPDGVYMRCLEEPKFATFDRFNPYLNTDFSIDWTTITIYVISFFCICFSYSAFSGEKEAGTLKLILSNSLSHSSIIIAKFFGVLIIFLIPILIGILISCLIFETSAIVNLNITDYAKIAYFFFATILLVSITILIGFLVSALTEKSHVSLVICLACWTLLVIVIPNIAWILIRQTDRIPPESNIIKEEEIQKNNLVNCFGGWDDNWNTPSQRVLDRKDCSDRQTNIHNSLWSEYQNLQLRQTQKSINISQISPFGLYRFLGDRISGNNYYGYFSFFNQVKEYQTIYRDYIFQKDMEDVKSHHLIWNEPYFCASFMSEQKINPLEVPKLTLKTSSFGKVLTDSVGGIFFLCMWIFILFLSSFIAFVRYDVR
jgi:ABC-type transport system involved in multi-copper enzyme maturation permease subunit